MTECNHDQCVSAGKGYCWHDMLVEFGECDDPECETCNESREDRRVREPYIDRPASR